MISRNPNEEKLTSAQTNAFLNFWGQIKHECWAFVTNLLRKLVLHNSSDWHSKILVFGMNQIMPWNENDPVEFSLSAEDLMNVMNSLPLERFPLMNAFADKQPNP